MAEGAERQHLDREPQLDEDAAACEAVLFAVARPLTLHELAAALNVEAARAGRALGTLKAHLERFEHGVQLVEVAEGYQLVTRARFFGILRRAAGAVRRPGLSGAAMETLAIVAYRQPVSRAQIEAIRGVNSEAALNTLQERGLIEVDHRGASPGRPRYYRTTRRFLELFGLRSLAELPPVQDGLPPQGMGGPPAAKTTPEQ